MLKAFIFPGQGSQATGMGKSFFENFLESRHTFEEASDACGIDLAKLCFEGSNEELKKTENTQPALVVTEVAIARGLQTAGLKVDLLAGHSVGEYSAFVIAGSMNLRDAIIGVRKRGQWMQEAVTLGEGGMLAVIGLSVDECDTLAKWTEANSGEGPVEPANYNAPLQTVLSGKMAALKWLQANIKNYPLSETKKIRLIPLKVSAPFHCSLMKSAQQKMANYLDTVEIREAAFPIVQNVTATPETQPLNLKENLKNQVSRPVRWVQSLHKINFVGEGNLCLIEVGPGRVLTGLNEKTLSSGQFLSCSDITDVEKLLKTQEDLN